jgi:hypothetical protein
VESKEAQMDTAKHEKHAKVTLVWGGTGETKSADVGVDETAGQVFELVYDRFHQKKSEQDTFEVDSRDYPRSRFGETVKSLLEQFGRELVFEVIPPTSGA